MKFKLYQGDCLERLKQVGHVTCIFADPPDNIGLGYDTYSDKKADADYEQLLFKWISAFVQKADIVWLSFNAQWIATVGTIVRSLIGEHNPFELEFKPCVQVFTFGQPTRTTWGTTTGRSGASCGKTPSCTLTPSRCLPGGSETATSGRPLAAGARRCLRSPISQDGGPAIATVKAGDAVVGEAGPIQYHAGDVFDFPRVTGNSAQRCDWHPTQLHEELVERCIKLSTTEGDTVVDPFGGTGTTLRVCMKLDRPCSIIELDEGYCRQIAKLNGLKVCRSPGTWGK
jgi:hypothetical protein